MSNASPEWVPVGDVNRRRKTWHVAHLDIVDEPMFLSLVKYRMPKDRVPSDYQANVVSSHLTDGSSKHAPILDLDFPHAYVPDENGKSVLYVEVSPETTRFVSLRIWLCHVIWRYVYRGRL